MQPAGAKREREERAPQLAPGWDRRGLALSPAEGFLLSRIDAQPPGRSCATSAASRPTRSTAVSNAGCRTAWSSWAGREVVGTRDPRRAAGWSPDGGKGESEIEFRPRDRGRGAAARPAIRGRARAALPRAARRGRGADAKAVKRAYFELSKEFHPDRYFRREIGSFAERLERIFKKIVEAYELLSDPTTRAEIERSMATARRRSGPGAAAGSRPAPQPATAALAAPRPWLSAPALERLRRHFRIPDEGAGRARSSRREQFRSGARRVAQAAAGSRPRQRAARHRLRPLERRVQGALRRMQAHVHEVRAAELLDRAEVAARGNAAQEALRMFEEALHYRPRDPVVNARAAELALEIGDWRRSRVRRDAPASCAPEVAAYQRTLGRVLRERGCSKRRARRSNERSRSTPRTTRLRMRLKKLRRLHTPQPRRQAMSRVIGIDLGTTNSCVAIDRRRASPS